MAFSEIDARRGLSSFLVGAGFIGLLLLLITKGLMVFAVAFSMVPVLAMLMSNRRVVFTLALFSSVALLGVPGIRVNSTSLAMLFQVVVLGLFYQDFLMRHKSLPRMDAVNTLLFVFLGNLILTASIRGFGLYQLGGDMIGGMVYIQIILGFLFLWYLRTMVWEPRQVVRVFALLVVGSLIPFLVQMAVVRIPGMLPLSNFFVFSMARVEAAMASEGSGRYETVVNFSYFIICSGVILNAGKKHWGLILALGGVLLLLLSGFRRYAILSMFVLMLSSVLLSKHRIRSLILWGIAGVAGLVVAYSTIDSLPPNIQRALSILPGIGVDSYAIRSAEGSFEWRMDIYQLCMEDLPNYLLLGKGLLLTLEETMYSLSYREWSGFTPFYAFFTHNYHNGIFEQLLDFGVVGFLSFFIFSTAYLTRIWTHMWRKRDDSTVWRVMVSMWVVCVALLADYFLVRGEFANFLAPYLIFYGMMILAYNAHLNSLKKLEISAESTDPSA